ncbi:hypothetical protein [Burkholderia cepacia]|uniref:hypothetical protein n=1 Tax=Burkholderia cepacia TaxID=292 RepID=UPI00075585CD|nr:hypothetical protein [Burkholderia cepacia]
MGRTVFRLCYQPGRRFRDGRSQPHRLQRRFACFFWRDIGWFEYVEDALHCVAGEARHQRKRSKPEHVVKFDSNGQELT